MSDIILNEITKSYGDKKVLDRICFVFPENKENSVFGVSGCGKTTLLRIICGLETPDFGTVQGTEGKKISYLFQEDRLFPWLSAFENVKNVCLSKETASEILCELGIHKDDQKKHPFELSGGMSRRVAIARALAYGGDIFVIDEPFRGLDTESAKNAKEVIKKYTSGKTVITVTHDITEIREMNGKTLFM